MLKTRAYSIVFMAAACAIPALAVDGTTLINQSTVIAAGGFPYNVSAAGSYKLSGNLVVPNNSGIVIHANNVTLDLNGFTISCQSCNPAIQNNSGVFVGGTGVIIKNGAITGFTGLEPAGAIEVSNTFGLAAHTHVEISHVTITNNRFGINAFDNTDVIVGGCNISENSDFGILSTSTISVLNSSISNNGLVGVQVTDGLVSGNMITGNGNGSDPSFFSVNAGILVFHIANVTNNTISNNKVLGLCTQQSVSGTPLVGYGTNTFGGNSTDVCSTTGLISMKNNVSAGGVF